MNKFNPKRDTEMIVLHPEGTSELKKFSLFFIQDWDLFYADCDFADGVEMYCAELTPDRAKVLKRELAEFLEKYPDNEKMHEPWFWMGSDLWWPDTDHWAILKHACERL